MKELNLIEVGLNGCKGTVDKPCIFVRTSTITYDFTIEEIDKHTYVIPFLIDSYVG
ncbi:hypothetical protein D3C76_1756990 [compost metagenome]